LAGCPDLRRRRLNFMNWLFGIAAVVGVIATAEDLWRRRISNVVTGCAFCAGVCARTAIYGAEGALGAVLGALLGAAMFLVFYLAGGMGGGDIKLMGGFGAIVGNGQIVLAAVMAAILGALIALAYLGVAAGRRLAGPPGESRKTPALRKLAIPYAPAITLGVWLSFVPYLPFFD